MLMGRVGTINVSASFADVNALSPFKGFIDHDLKSAACLHKRLDYQAEQTSAQLHRGPPSSIEQVVRGAKIGCLCQPHLA
jgi:hypothetical protein